MPTRHVQIRLEEEEYASLTRHADSFGKSLQVVTKSLILKAIAEEDTDVAAVLTDEERTLIEGVLDMMRHPRDKQDEFVVHALQEIIKIRNNAKRARKS